MKKSIQRYRNHLKRTVQYRKVYVLGWDEESQTYIFLVASLEESALLNLALKEHRAGKIQLPTT
jgi:hypothetical protein